MRWISALILTCFAAATAASAQVPASDQTAIRAVLNRSYATTAANEPAHERRKFIGAGNGFAPLGRRPSRTVRVDPRWATCVAYYKVQQPGRTPLFHVAQWLATEQLLMGNKCGADTAYAALGLALDNLYAASRDQSLQAAALAYYEEASWLGTARAAH